MEEMQFDTEKKSDLTLILHTAARTAFIMLIALSILICMFFSFFPSLPQQLYYSLDNYPQALRYARIRANALKNGEPEKYCTALQDVVTLADKLFSDKGDAYAEALFDSTFILMNIPTVGEFNRKTDEFNYNNSAPSYRAVVYSNEAYLRKLCFLGAIKARGRVAFYVNERFQSFDDILSESFKKTYADAVKHSYLFIQLYELLKRDIYFDLPIELAERFTSFREYALDFKGDEDALMGDSALAKLYLVRVAGLFSHMAAEKFDTKEWNALNTLDSDGEKVEIIRYYSETLLTDYISGQSIN